MVLDLDADTLWLQPAAASLAERIAK